MKSRKERKSRGRILILFWLVLVLFSLLSVATYTWFTLSRTPKVSDMSLYVNCNTGMELAWSVDSAEWSQHLKYEDVATEMAPLKPVTWSEQQQAFYAAEFGMDGRISGISHKLSDDNNANQNNSNGYYMKTTFYARTGEPVSVTLSSPVERTDKVMGAGTYLIGTPVWNEQEILHNDGGHGAEYAMRMGIRVTKMDLQGAALEGESAFYIFEPNCDRHIDGTSGYISTPSMDGTANLITEEKLICQTSSTWTEAYPVEKNVVIYEWGQFLSEPELFSLATDELAQIEVYIWLEGQDIDCNNQIGQAAQMLANIQFEAQTGEQPGLEPIEDKN